MAKSEIMITLEKTGLPVRYGLFKEPQEPPFIVYMGDGQEKTAGDDTYVDTQNNYRIEYYFIEKSSTNEEAIEAALLADGWLYEKSEDIYIEDEKIFVVYYYV